MSLKRIFKQKFKLGLFDNPYLEENSLLSLDNKKYRNGKAGTAKISCIIKKYWDTTFRPNSRIYLHGFDDNLSKKINKVSLEETEVIVAKVKTPSWGEKTVSRLWKNF